MNADESHGPYTLLYFFLNPQALVSLRMCILSDVVVIVVIGATLVPPRDEVSPVGTAIVHRTVELEGLA